MDEVIGFLAVLFIFGGGFVVAMTSIVLNYISKKKGLTRSASRRELQEIYRALNEIRQDLSILREQQADMMLMYHEPAPAAIPKERLKEEDPS